jgi:hypothetical protein
MLKLLKAHGDGKRFGRMAVTDGAKRDGHYALVIAQKGHSCPHLRGEVRELGKAAYRLVHPIRQDAVALLARTQIQITLKGGRIEVSYKQDGDIRKMSVSLPKGICATINTPAGDSITLQGPATAEF